MVRRTAHAVTFGLLLWLGWLGWPAAARADEALSIEEAVKLALAGNERSLKAPLRIDAAEGSLERARAGFLPTLVAQGSATVDAHQGQGGRIWAAGGTLTLSQPLVNPSAYPLYTQAQHQLESERYGSIQDRRQLAFDTARAYLLALASERVVAAGTRRLEHSKASQADTEARAQAGLNSTNDVTRLSLETATASSTLSQAHGNLATAYLQLAFLVGREVKGPLVASEHTSANARRTPPSLDRVILNAEQRRPDVRSSQELTLALREFAKEPLYRLAPTLSLQAQLRAVVAPLPGERGLDESVGLTLTWTLYDAGVRYADRRTRLAQAESQALNERQLRRSVATDVSIALSTLQAARATFQIADDAVAIAQRNTEETAILYKQGLARAIELTNANATQYDTEVTRESAKLSMEQAYLDLRFALGLDPLGAAVAASSSPQPIDPEPSAPLGSGAPAGPAPPVGVVLPVVPPPPGGRPGAVKP